MLYPRSLNSDPHNDEMQLFFLLNATYLPDANISPATITAHCLGETTTQGSNKLTTHNIMPARQRTRAIVVSTSIATQSTEANSEIHVYFSHTNELGHSKTYINYA